MKEIKRAIVALDLSDMDQHLLEYSKFLTRTLGIDKIYFVHIIPNFVQPKNVDLDFHKAFSVASPIDEKVRTLIQEKVKTKFNGTAENLSLEVEVVEGVPSKKIIHWTDVKEVDLLITGKKSKSEGSGITPRRIAQKAKCNVLFVPEKPNTSPKKILVPIDFSKNSARALKSALYFKSVDPEVEIHMAHILALLPRDYYYGLDQNSSYRIAFKKEAMKAFDRFIEEHELPKDLIIPHFIQDRYNSAYRHLLEFTETKSFDMIIMGAKGHSRFENFLYGSFTERFVEYSEGVPIMIVR